MTHLVHPYEDLPDNPPLRGNLHSHTNASDGRRPAQEVVDDYAHRGYDWLMISDHDIYTSPRDHEALDSHGMTLIPGNEVSAAGVHLLHVGADRRLEPLAQRQRLLNELAHIPGFAIINHPNWQRHFNHCTIEQLSQWVGYHGIEVYNATINRLPGSPYATDKWDMLLSQDRRVWGYANDDSHFPVEDVGLGWNAVYAAESSVQAITDALARGRFYASTGVTITGIEVDAMTVRVRTAEAERVIAYTDHGRRLAQADNAELEVEVPDDRRYVRFECLGRGEQFAWTQPFFVEP